MRIAVIETKTNTHSIYENGKLLQSNIFSRLLFKEELDEYVKDPQAFVNAVGTTEE